jgi:hypothetical protein
MEFKMPVADALMVLKNYSNTGEISQAKGIPIEYLESVRQAVRSVNPGRTVRVRFRGPRNHPTDRRPASTRQSVCLKQFATSFAVYVD